MSLFSLFRGARASRRPAVSPARLALEGLEDRQLLSGNPISISGYVFDDANGNGLLDTGESRVPGNGVELHRGGAAGPVVATAVTNASGYYEFNADATVNQAPQTRTVVVSFSGGRTGWTQSAQVAQFDPSLGTLTSVVITNTASFKSQVQFENLDEEDAALSATVNGTLTVSSTGLAPLTATTSISDAFTATAFDGEVDSAGTSGHDSGQKTGTGTQSVTLTSAADLARFTGTGSVSFTGRARATSATSGPGNMFALIQTEAGATVQVVYTYIPSNALQPGDYTIVQGSQPSGYLDGGESRGGVVIPGSIGGTSLIPVTLGSASLTNNNFAEVRPAAVSGCVYIDSNDNGVKDPGEPPVPAGVTMQLTGTDDMGVVLARTVETDAAGSYRFDNLRPGTYTVTELTQAAGYLSSYKTRGNVTRIEGSNAAADQISGLTVAPGQTSDNNNFGKVRSSSIAGQVYVDLNNDGIRQAAEAPISNVTLTLTGTNSLGQLVNVVVKTDASGAYRFDGLRAGSYTVTETQPAGYNDSLATVGSVGGTAGANQLSLALPSGTAATEYNFGERLPPGQPQVVVTPPPATPNPVVSKAQLLVKLNWKR